MPMPGEITVEARFIVPVKKAKIVPSILAGVILAKSARIGKVYRRVPTTLNTISVKSKNTRSSIPISLFHLFAKQKLRKVETT